MTAVTEAPSNDPTGTTPESEGRRAERKLGLLLIAPAALVMFLVTAYPILYAFWLSLHKSSLAYPGQDEFIASATTSPCSRTATGGRRWG